MTLKFLYHRHPFNGAGAVKLFTSYKEMVDWMTAHLAEMARSHVADQSWRKKWGMDRFPAQLEKLLKEKIPAEHQSKLGYSSLSMEFRYFGEPRIVIGKEKPLLDPMPKEHYTSFGEYEISYSCSLPIEVRAKYTTEEGEVKEAGKPYIPAHKKEFYTEPFKVYQIGKDWNNTFSLVDIGAGCEPWYYCFTNSHIEIVHHGD